MQLSEPLQVTALLAQVLDELQIPYLVGGSLASSIHGIPRATQDVDIGLSSFGNVLVISHTFRNDNIRIISARKAMKKERHFYETETIL